MPGLPAPACRLLYKLSPRALRTRLVRHLPMADDFTVQAPGGTAVRLSGPDQSELLRSLFWRGFDGHEPETVALFCRLARRASVVLDVGAYVFYYGLLAARVNAAAAVFCFEPLPEPCALGERFARLNRLSNLTAVPLAVSDRQGEADLFVPDRSLSRLPNISSLRNRFRDGETFADRGSRRLRVQTTTIDIFVAQRQLAAVDLIKIDTEETELEVLRGAAQAIARFRPHIILEVIGSQAASDVMQLLAPQGYGFFSIEGGLRRIEAAEDLALRSFHRGAYGEILCSGRDLVDFQGQS